MNLYAYDLSVLDFNLNFADPYNEPFSLLRASTAVSTTALSDDYDGVHRASWGEKDNRAMPTASPPKHRHDGSSPLPLGMDWSPPPRKWDVRNSLWPHDPPTGWSYCVTIPSWTFLPQSSGSDPVVVYMVQVGLQSPEGITTVREISRRFNEFLVLFFEIKRALPKKQLPPAPPKRVLRMKNKTFYEDRRSSLEEWMGRLLSDIDVSRSVPVANFLDLEAAVRSFFNDVSHQESDDVSSNNIMVPPLPQTNSTASVGAASFTAFGRCDDTCCETEHVACRHGDEGNTESGMDERTFEKGRVPFDGSGMEDLVASLNQEIALRKFLETKVKNLELELETTKTCSEVYIQQESFNGKEKFTQLQRNMEELRRKCLEMSVKLESDQDENVHSGPTAESILEENIILLQGLDASREQLENLQKQYEEFVTKSKADVKLLHKEVKSLQGVQLDLKQEFSQLMKEKSELERVLQTERRKMEHANIANQKLLHDCEILHNHLQGCSVHSLLDIEHNLNVETSTSDARDLLAASDNRITHFFSEAKLLEQYVDNDDGRVSANLNGSDEGASSNALRKMLIDVQLENGRLRMQVNSVIRCALNAKGTTKKDEEDESI